MGADDDGRILDLSRLAEASGPEIGRIQDKS
jgi:hypothetical protein